MQFIFGKNVERTAREKRNRKKNVRYYIYTNTLPIYDIKTYTRINQMHLKGGFKRK